MLGIVENTAAVPNADTRRLSARINDEMAEKGVVGFAAVIPTPGFAGAWIRGVVTALNLLARRRYPFRVFETTDDACGWLAQVLGDCTMASRGVAWSIERFRDEYVRFWARECQRHADSRNWQQGQGSDWSASSLGR
jgi:hypothetical protein